jgi:hypothetical protein
VGGWCFALETSTGFQRLALPVDWSPYPLVVLKVAVLAARSFFGAARAYPHRRDLLLSQQDLCRRLASAELWLLALVLLCLVILVGFFFRLALQPAAGEDTLALLLELAILVSALA